MVSTEILRRLRRLEIKTSRLVEGELAGGYLSSFKGRGIEFTEVREYIEGDDVRAIDWNVTARMGAPFVKTFMEERDLTVIVAADLSGSMEFGTTVQTKRGLALDFAAAAALLAVKNNDRIGLLAYTDRMEAFIPPRKGRKHVMRVLSGLASLVPLGRGSAHSEAARFLLRAQKGRATVFWVSDFMGGLDLRALKAVSLRHELVPVHLTDRREVEMPPVGLMELADPETGEKALVDVSSPAFRDAHSMMLREAEAKREAAFRAVKAEPIELCTGASPIPPLMRYFRRKARRRR